MTNQLHRWDCTPSEAIAIQKALRERVVIKGKPKILHFIAGVDIALTPQRKGYCIIAVFRFSTLNLYEEVFSSGTIAFPYVPGLLSFREGPLFLQAYSRLSVKPDVIVFDGHGIAHPRRFGIASHMGVLLNTVTIGCAKSRLCGMYQEPGIKRGDRSYLYDGKDIIGVVLRTRNGVKPVFVSPGYNIGIDDAAEIIMQCTGKYRVPEPIRYAHCRVGNFKKISENSKG